MPARDLFLLTHACVQVRNHDSWLPAVFLGGRESTGGQMSGSASHLGRRRRLRV